MRFWQRTKRLERMQMCACSLCRLGQWPKIYDRHVTFRTRGWTSLSMAFWQLSQDFQYTWISSPRSWHKDGNAVGLINQGEEGKVPRLVKTMEKLLTRRKKFIQEDIVYWEKVRWVLVKRSTTKRIRTVGIRRWIHERKSPPKDKVKVCPSIRPCDQSKVCSNPE